jgi:phage tail sheath protein FI
MIMAFQISPGVNVSEVDLTTVVPAVSTTVGGIAGHFSWGPVQQRVLIDNEDTLATQFAKPNANTASDFFTAASFLGYGNSLFVVRVINEAGTTSNARNATSNAANTVNTVIKNEDDYELNYINGVSGVGSWVAKYPGVLGNSLRVSVCSSSNAYQSTLTGTLAFTNNSTTVTGIGTAFTTQVRVGDILLAGPDRAEVKVASVGTANTLTLQSRYVGNTVATQSSVARRWEFFNFFDAAPGTSEYASRQGGSNDEMHIVVADEDGAWTGRANNVIERFAAVSEASDALTQDGATNYYKNVINERSQFVWWTAHPTGMTNAGRPAAGVNFGLGSQARPFNDSLTNGRDGATPRSSDYINGFNKFANPEEVDVSLILTGDGNVTKAVHVINNIAEVRKDCIAVVSPRRSDVVNNSTYVGKETDDSITFRNLLPSSSYAVLDGGYKYIYDKYNDIYRYVPLNGDTAGLMVRTDNERDPWFSPAGFNRGQVKNVIKLSFNPTKSQRDQLYKNGINPVVTFPGQGTVLFGDKTLLAKPSAFDRINVRRLFIVLEKAISTAAKFTLFEFNDEFTRAQFRNLVEPFLRDVQGRRGIFDFRVVCDETNNTPEVIDRNEFVGDIYVKPARSINFIQLNFVAVRTGVEFTEVVGRA